MVSSLRPKIYALFLIDDKARWRVFVLATGLGALAGIVSEDVFGAPLEKANLACVISILVTLFYGCVSYRNSHIPSKVRPEFHLGPITQRVAYVLVVCALLVAGAYLPLQSSILNKTLQRIATQTPTESALRQARSILDTAALSRAKATPAVFSRVRRMLDEGLAKPQLQQTAWLTRLAALHYSTATFSKPAPRGITPPPNTPIANFWVISTVAGQNDAQISASGRITSPSDGAIYQQFGTANLNASAKYAPTYIIVSSPSGVILDGEMLRQVWLKNTRIVYNGGPLMLEDVHFVNCTFEMPDNSNSRMLAAMILNHPSDVDLSTTV
jgi:hypothetical protein